MTDSWQLQMKYVTHSSFYTSGTCFRRNVYYLHLFPIIPHGLNDTNPSTSLFMHTLFTWTQNMHLNRVCVCHSTASWLVFMKKFRAALARRTRTEEMTRRAPVLIISPVPAPPASAAQHLIMSQPWSARC